MDFRMLYFDTNNLPLGMDSVKKRVNCLKRNVIDFNQH